MILLFSLGSYTAILILFIVLISSGLYVIFIPLIRKKKICKKLEQFFCEQQISFQKSKGELYDYQFQTKKGHGHIKLLEIPANSDLQINNKTTWQLFKNVSMHKETYQSSFVQNLENFLLSDLTYKFVLLTQKPSHRKVVLNECEMKLFDGHDIIYDVQILSPDEWAELIKN